MHKPFPRVQTNWFSILDTLNSVDPSKAFKINTPFYQYDGTVGGFLPLRAEFRKQLLDFLQRKDPSGGWTDRTKKKKSGDKHGG